MGTVHGIMKKYGIGFPKAMEKRGKTYLTYLITKKQIIAVIIGKNRSYLPDNKKTYVIKDVTNKK